MTREESTMARLGGKALAVVTQVSPGGPADRAGVKGGDIVLEADGTTDPSASQLVEAAKDGQLLLRLRRRDATFYAVMKR